MPYETLQNIRQDYEEPLYFHVEKLQTSVTENLELDCVLKFLNYFSILTATHIGDYLISGGFAMNYIDKDHKYNDIDIFVLNEIDNSKLLTVFHKLNQLGTVKNFEISKKQDSKEYQNKSFISKIANFNIGHLNIQMIFTHCISPAEVLKSFDFKTCMVGIHPGLDHDIKLFADLVYCTNTIDLILEKRLEVNPNFIVEETRIQKYKEKGYSFR
jgi:hydrogenase maturation factor